MEIKTLPAIEYCGYVTDGTHDSPKAKENGYRLITSKHLGRYSIDFESANYISEEDYLKVIARSAVSQWDILFSMIGTIGNMYLETNEQVEYACKNMGIFKLNGDEGKAKWLYYYLQSPKAREYVQTSARGTTQGYVPLGTLRNLPVDYPADDILRDKISGFLWNIDEKIKCNSAINDNLFQQLFALYDNSFASTTYDEVELKTLCRFQEGYVNPAQTHPEYIDGDVKWLRAVDINESFIIETSRTLTQTGFQSAKKSAFLFSPNTIAISKSGTIGRLGIVADYMCGNRAVINIAPNDVSLLPFIYAYLKSHQIEFPDLAVGSVQKNLYVSLLEPLIVRIPDSDTLSEFCNAGNAILETVSNNCQENIRLGQIRDTLLPKLMSGELNVSNIEL